VADRLTQARADLAADLAPLLHTGRVHLYPPAQLVSPAIYIETSTGSMATEGNTRYVVATFAVVVVTDGDVKPQNLTLDELIAQVVDAARTRNRTVTGWTAGSVDVGGTSQRSATVNVDVPIVARTLCDPTVT
jgi:hypothetical protein